MSIHTVSPAPHFAKKRDQADNCISKHQFPQRFDFKGGSSFETKVPSDLAFQVSGASFLGLYKSKSPACSLLYLKAFSPSPAETGESAVISEIWGLKQERRESKRRLQRPWSLWERMTQLLQLSLWRCELHEPALPGLLESRKGRTPWGSPDRVS